MQSRVIEICLSAHAALVSEKGGLIEPFVPRTCNAYVAGASCACAQTLNAKRAPISKFEAD